MRDALPTLPLDGPPAGLHRLSAILQSSRGGASGPLYAGFVLAAAERLTSSPTADPTAGVEAFAASCTRVGDRTMLDALLTASEALSANLHSGRPRLTALAAALEAAARGSEATADLPPRRGRSSYLSDRILGHTDPGPWPSRPGSGQWRRRCRLERRSSIGWQGSPSDPCPPTSRDSCSSLKR